MAPTVHEFHAMGSDCALHLVAAPDAMRVAFAAEAEIRRIEQRFSRFDEASELSRINRVARLGGSTRIDDETAELVKFAAACHARSDGAFDITAGALRAAWDFRAGRLPDQAALDALRPCVGMDLLRLDGDCLHFAHAGMALDFGGIGKEYAADRAAELCLAHGVRHGFVNLAGDIRVIGPQPDGAPWRIGIRHPRAADRLLAVIAIAEGGLATSGDYERFIDIAGRRYCHILDARSFWPAQGLCAATVLAPRCLVAGALATIAMLKGTDAANWLRGLGLRHLVVDASLAVSGTEPVSSGD